MNEAFLHYLWQFQYFDKKELKTTLGESIVVRKPGILNTDAGPDFSQASVVIDGIEWAGTVEVHLKSSGWVAHQHHTDKAYDNVILHLVWEDDKPVFREDGTQLPTLVLKERVDKNLLTEYKKLVNNASTVPCEKSFHLIDDFQKVSMVEKALMKRLETKAEYVSKLLAANKGDWEETTYQLLASAFGFKVNKEPFLQLTKALPYKILQKHGNSLLQMEALLFGQAGMLPAKSKDEYISQLFDEYQFLSNKYSLKEGEMNYAQWKFLRLRPANFPTLRLAQFASLLFNNKSIFSKLIENPEVNSLSKIFNILPSAYWQSHYRFGQKSKDEIHHFGEASAQIIMINVVAPLLVAYGKGRDDWSKVDQAVNLLQNIPAEKNKITTFWKDLGYASKSAMDSQGLIELYQSYCQHRQCLNCNIGVAILNPFAKA